MNKTAIYAHELIGETILVVDSTNPSLRGIKGVVVDEHKETVTLQIPHSNSITLLKQVVTFKVLSSGKILSGASLRKRPEERIKG